MSDRCRRGLRVFAVLVVGCGGSHTSDDVEPEAGSVCGPSEDAAVDDAVFVALTSRSWADSGCASTAPLPPTCRRLSLGGDGRYSWSAWSDYPEREQAGRWNFRARDGSSGVVCFDDGSVIGFALGDDELTFANHAYGADEPREVGADRGSLPEVTASALFSELTAQEWRKTNAFDAVFRPEGFRLRRDGTFWASYRGGECEHGGVFSLDHGEGGMLIPISEPNECDVRREPAAASIGPSNGRPVIRDGVLMQGIGETYRDAAIETDEQSFAFRAYGWDGGLMVSGSLTGELEAGRTLTIGLALENLGATTQTLEGGAISMQPLMPDLSVAGEPIVLGELAVGGSVAPGSEVPTSVEATLPGAGMYALEVSVRSSDASQPWSNRTSYLVEVR
jgi:hypothetical protein